MRPTALSKRPARLVISTVIVCLGALSAGAVETNTPDLVNRKVLRVCGTPDNLPYSNQKFEGFENKIISIIADELKLPVEYTWFPQGMGFVRKTLTAKKCDVVPGTVQADEFTLNTNHYFRTTYALVYKPGKGLDGLTSLFDERLKGKVVGIQAGAPAGDYVAKAGLMEKARPYKFFVDTRYENPMGEMVKDLRADEIDVAILWGPYAGHFTDGGKDVTIAPMLEEQTGLPKLEYRITMGVRAGDVTWKRQLNDIIKKRQADIDKVLLEYGVPLIDEDNKMITAPRS
jgi:quinoprotein dehydrogenase-associated probable ABC transporter substrate-binding protein